MTVRNIYFLTICLVNASCTSQKNVVPESYQERDFICGYEIGRKYNDIERGERKYRPVCLIEIDQVIKDSDTLEIHELICVDSVKFTQAFKDFKVNDICIEMGIQGKTFFTATTNKYGGFEEVKVVRRVDNCLHDLEEKIKQKVLRMRIIPEDAGTYEIVFSHSLRLY